MKKIIIREMHIKDIDEVLIIENLCFTMPWSKKAFEEDLNKNKLSKYIVAEHNKDVVGYIGVWRILDEGHITNIAVHPKFRKRGIARALMENLIQILKRESIIKMTLEVRASNVPAINLYNQLGFKPEGIRKAYYEDNKEDALIMWKELL